MPALKVKENQGATVIKMPDRKNQSYILNEYFDTVARIRIPGEQMQILSFIVRKTWCWGKDSDRIAVSQIVNATGLKKQNVFRSILSLKDKNIISVIKNDDKSMQLIEININFEAWKPSSKKITSSNLIHGVIKNDSKASSKVMDTKDTITKDTITKDTILSFPTSVGDNEQNSEEQTQVKSKKLSCLSKPQLKRFVEFWDSYPQHRRKDKAKAERAFKDLNPDDELFAAIMAGLEAAKKSQDWQKDGGRYVCYPERFLKNQKWLDEYDDTKGRKSTGCPMTNYMPPKDLNAAAEKYANLLPSEPEF